MCPVEDVLQQQLSLWSPGYFPCASASCWAWHCGSGGGGSVWFQVTRSCVGGLGCRWVCLLIGNAPPPPPPFHYPTPSVPIKAANVSSWLIMRYTSRAVCLQGSETPLCINRAPIHKIGGDVFTNLSTGGGFLTSAAICGWSFLGRGDFWPECIWKDKYHTDISCQLQHRFTLLYAGAARNSQYIDSTIKRKWITTWFDWFQLLSVGICSFSCHLWLKMKSLGCCSCDFRTYWKKMSYSLVKNCLFLLKCLCDQSNISQQKTALKREYCRVCWKHFTVFSLHQVKCSGSWTDLDFLKLKLALIHCFLFAFSGV